MLPPELYIKGIFQVHRWIRFNENSERQVPDTPVDLCQKRKLQIHGWPYLNDTFLDILQGRFQIHRLIYFKNENSKYTAGLI